MTTWFNRLSVAAKAIAQVADLTDADIAEAQLSKQLASEAAAQVAPIHAVLDFWRAMRWIVPGWPVDKLSRLPAGDRVLHGDFHPYNILGSLDGAVVVGTATRSVCEPGYIRRRIAGQHWQATIRPGQRYRLAHAA